MALTRKQELFLMQIGIQTLHEGIQTQKELKDESSVAVEKKSRKSNSKKYWTQTAKGRKRMSEIMRKRWIDKQKVISK